jgi:HNH endonuclease/Terminase large subunit, T4likevirus-type, N-terminal
MATTPSPTSSAKRFERFCGLVALELEPFQRKIVRELYGSRELLVLCPRGNGKTTLFAALALFHLVMTREPAVYVAAASRDQARLTFETARKMAARHAAVEQRVTPRWNELRVKDGFLRVLSSDAPRAHGGGEEDRPRLAAGQGEVRRSDRRRGRPGDGRRARRGKARAGRTTRVAMSAFPRICLGCGRRFRPRAGERRCPRCNVGVRTGSTRAWRRLRAEILASGPPCVYCGAPATTVDHVMPVSRGGAELDPANCVPACADCNGRKGAD